MSFSASRFLYSGLDSAIVSRVCAIRIRRVQGKTSRRSKRSQRRSRIPSRSRSHTLGRKLRRFLFSLYSEKGGDLELASWLRRVEAFPSIRLASPGAPRSLHQRGVLHFAATLGSQAAFDVEMEGDKARGITDTRVLRPASRAARILAFRPRPDLEISADLVLHLHLPRVIERNRFGWAPHGKTDVPGWTQKWDLASKTTR